MKTKFKNVLVAIAAAGLLVATFGFVYNKSLGAKNDEVKKMEIAREQSFDSRDDFYFWLESGRAQQLEANIIGDAQATFYYIEFVPESAGINTYLAEIITPKTAEILIEKLNASKIPKPMLERMARIAWSGYRNEHRDVMEEINRLGDDSTKKVVAGLREVPSVNLKPYRILNEAQLEPALYLYLATREQRFLAKIANCMRFHDNPSPQRQKLAKAAEAMIRATSKLPHAREALTKLLSAPVKTGPAQTGLDPEVLDLVGEILDED